MSINPGARCDNCGFASHCGLPAGLFGRTEIGYECRVHAPAPTPNGIGRYFPIVNASDVCGDHEIGKPANG